MNRSITEVNKETLISVNQDSASKECSISAEKKLSDTTFHIPLT